MALKLARMATGRHKTLSMWDSFHGATLDAISVGGEALFRRNVGPLMPGSEHVPCLDQAARFFGPDRPFERLADYVDYILASEGDVAAFVAEPVRWTTVFPPPADFWPRVRESCSRHGTLLVFDEVPSGLGRTGTMFACEQFGAAPDILVIGKGSAAASCRSPRWLPTRRLDVGAEVALGHFTHERARSRRLPRWRRSTSSRTRACWLRARDLGRHGRSRLEEMSARLAASPRRGPQHRPLFRRRGYGANAGRGGGARPTVSLYAALRRGLSFKVGGGNVLTLCPPLTISTEQLDDAFDRLAAAIAD